MTTPNGDRHSTPAAFGGQTQSVLHARHEPPTVTFDARARYLQNLDAETIRGPLPTPDGKFFVILSPRYNREAIAMWRSLRGHSERKDWHTYWLLPTTIGWLKVDELYRRFFADDIRDARMRLAMANYALHNDLERELEARRSEHLHKKQCKEAAASAHHDLGAP